MTDIKINGKSITSINKDKNKLNDFINTFESDYRCIEDTASYIENVSIKSVEGVEMIETVWNSIINFFKNVCEFIGNIFRSKIYSHTAKKLIDRIVKLRTKDPGIDGKLDWNATTTLSKSTQVSVRKIEELLEAVDDDQGHAVGRNVKKDTISSNAIKAVEELRDLSDGAYEVSVTAALYVLSKNDEGAPLIKSGNPTERLDLLIKYLTCYKNNATSRLKALMRIDSRSNRHLNFAIKRKERKMKDEDSIDTYRLAVKINKLCLSICVKNIKSVFVATEVLLKTAKQ